MLLANLTLGYIGNQTRFLRPPSRQFWGSISSKSPKVGGHKTNQRGGSAVLAMLRNNSPAASKKGDFDSDSLLFQGGLGVDQTLEELSLYQVSFDRWKTSDNPENRAYNIPSKVA